MEKTLNARALVCATALIGTFSLTQSAFAQYGTRGSADGFSTVQPLFQSGVQDLSSPPAFQPQTVQPIQQGFQQPAFNQVQQIQVLPVQNVAPATNARGVTISSGTSGGGFVQPQPIQQPISSAPSGSIVTSVTNASGDINVFTGAPLQGFAIQGVEGGLPLVGEDYATLDLDGTLTPGTIGRGLTAAGQGREGRTEDPGVPGGRPSTFIQGGSGGNTVASVSSSSGSSTSSVSTSSGGARAATTASTRRFGADFDGPIRPGVSVPRPESKPARSTAPSRPATTTTARPSTNQVASAPTSTATDAAPATPRSQSVRQAPRSSLVAGDALGLRTTPTAPTTATPATPAPSTNTNTEVASANPQPEAPEATPAAPDPRLLRILFPSGSSALPDQSRDFLTRLANSMKADESIRIQLLSYASLPNQGSTDARRLSLSRALAVRSFLISEGVNDQRILVRAEGDRNAGAEPDRIDINRID